MIDPTRQIGATLREVNSRDHEGREARVIVASRTYDTSVDDLWDALTNGERIPRWFLPISGDLRLGGRYQFEGNAGGEITACEPPRRLAATWEFGGGVSWVTLNLAKDPAGGARLELEHVAHVDDETWQKFGPGAVGIGWDGGFMGLGEHLASGEAVDRAEARAWMASGEGKAFSRRSSEAWLAAWLASGAEETMARAAADRTTAFYTGEG